MLFHDLRVSSQGNELGFELVLLSSKLKLRNRQHQARTGDRRMTKPNITDTPSLVLV